jgi:hypothetical protein
MEAIRQIVKIPKSHEVLIKIPDHIAEDELMEVILIVKRRKRSYKAKMEQMKQAVKDPMFLADMKAVNRDFEHADSDGWE